MHAMFLPPLKISLKMHLNQTLSSNSTFLLRCRLHSHLPPVIRSLAAQGERRKRQGLEEKKMKIQCIDFPWTASVNTTAHPDAYYINTHSLWRGSSGLRTRCSDDSGPKCLS